MVTVVVPEVKPDPVIATVRGVARDGAACAGTRDVTVANDCVTVIVMATVTGPPPAYVMVTVPVNWAPTAALLRTSLRKLTTIAAPKLDAIPLGALREIQLAGTFSCTVAGLVVLTAAIVNATGWPLETTVSGWVRGPEP